MSDNSNIQYVTYKVAADGSKVKHASGDVQLFWLKHYAAKLSRECRVTSCALGVGKLMMTVVDNGSVYITEFSGDQNDIWELQPYIKVTVESK